MSAPTPAKRRHHSAASIEQRQLVNDVGSNEKEIVLKDVEDEEEKEASLQDSRKFNSQVSKKIGHFERLSLADQRLLLLSSQQQQQQEDGTCFHHEQAAWQDQFDEHTERRECESEMAPDYYGSLPDDDDDDDDDADADEEEEYLVLDTIIEEDEENVEPASNKSDCDKIVKCCEGNEQQAATGTRCDLPQATILSISEQNNTESMATNDNSLVYASSTRTEDSSKMQTNQEQKQQQQQQQQAILQDKMNNNNNKHLLLPSTNRLISEHQARQQQATLFRVLTERQRLLDELEPDERLEQADLMSGHFVVTAANHRRLKLKKQTAISATDTPSRRRKRRPRRPASENVPLSSVDLSSISDRQLDEMLGQLASASSSSSSSSSSSCSSSSSTRFSEEESDDLDDEMISEPAAEASVSPHSSALLSERGQRNSPASLGARPNVVGVHEDERAAGQRLGGQAPAKCRDTHKRLARRDSRDSDEDESQDLLKVETATGAIDRPGSSSPQSNSVEAVLGRMLEALEEAASGRRQLASPSSDASDPDGRGPNPDDEAQLSELLERGFSHLEQLLACSLGGPLGQLSSQQPVATRTTSATLVSQKDSDYGSDTQSAGDCFSSSICQVEQHRVTSSSHLSPVAIELSFRLAESLRQLAQRQQQNQQRQRTTVAGGPQASVETHSIKTSVSTTPSDELGGELASSGSSACSTQKRKRAPMRSIVMIGSPDPGNATPPAPVADGRTRVNIKQKSEQDHHHHQLQQVVQVVHQSSASQQQQQQFERAPRRSSIRGSLRRKASLRREPGAPRPASPRPKELLETARATSVEQQQASRDQQQEAKRNEPTRQVVEVCEMKAQQVGAIKHQDPKQQRQLQRALVLAQKYNYSPAKLAASKLGSKLGVVAAATSDVQQTGTTTATGIPASSDQKINKPAQIQLDISYFAKSGSLTVHLLRCSSLVAANKRRETSNPYVKLYLLPDRSKKGKRKSCVMRHNLEPEFDERFTFGPIHLADFKRANRTIWASVWHKDRLGKRNEFLGELLLPLEQVRQTLLTSDLCQSTGPKWYNLQNQQITTTTTTTGVNQTGLETTRRLQYSSAARLEQQQAAEQVARKLSEFERKAQQLAASAIGSPAPPDFGKTSSSLERLSKQQVALKTQEISSNQNGFSASSNLESRVGSNEFVENFKLAPKQDSQAQQTTSSGQLFVALKFSPQTEDLLAKRSAQMEGQLRLLIKEARLTGSNSLLSPQCKCYLLSATGQRVAKLKTQQLRKTLNPRWDQELTFSSLKLAQLSGQAIEIQLINRDLSVALSAASGRGADSSELGGIRLCKRLDEASIEPEQEQIASEKEAKLWNQMLERPNIWVYGELPLRQLRPLVER